MIFHFCKRGVMCDEIPGNSYKKDEGHISSLFEILSPLILIRVGRIEG